MRKDSLLMIALGKGKKKGPPPPPDDGEGADDEDGLEYGQDEGSDADPDEDAEDDDEKKGYSPEDCAHDAFEAIRSDDARGFVEAIKAIVAASDEG